MPEIRFSPSSIRKLADIQRYFMLELHLPESAISTVKQIIDDITILENNPEIGPKLSSRVEKIPSRFSETRFLVCGDYLAIYDQSTEMVEILMIYHGREDVFGRFLKEIE